MRSGVEDFQDVMDLLMRRSRLAAAYKAESREAEG